MPRYSDHLDRVSVTKDQWIVGGQRVRSVMTLNSRKFLDSFDDSVTLDRYSPIVQKRIGAPHQNNVKISGTFRTNYEHSDDSMWGGYSFIQVRKNSTGRASAYAGYGVAWRPSAPGKNDLYDISGAIQDEVTGLWDIDCDDPDVDADDTLYLMQKRGDETYYIPFQHNGYVGGELKGCQITADAVTPNDKIALMAPNVYIVDNNPMHGDGYASKYIIDPLSGLSYIEAGTHLIKKDNTYGFEISIQGDDSIVFRIRDITGGGEIADVLESGATTTLSTYLNDADADSFGISVYDTCGYQWWYDDIKIEKLANEYAAMYFSMDVSGMPDILQVELGATGVAPTGDGFVAEVWNEEYSSWDNILRYGLSDHATVLSKTFSKREYSNEGMVTIRVRTLGTSNTQETADIDVDSIRIVRGMAPGIHIGGCLDVYIDDPDAKVNTATVELDEDGTMADVSNYPNIVRVSRGISELVYGVDYVIISGDPGAYNSPNSKTVIRVSGEHAGAAILVSYWSSDVLLDIASKLDESEHKPVGTNVLVKHKVIHEVRTSEGVEYLKDYVDQLKYVEGHKTISYSEFTKYVYGVTGTYIDPDITIHAFDGKERRMSALNFMGQEYTVDDTETFRVIDE